jgi:hypothetical protein
MKELRDTMGHLVNLAERIDDRVERIDHRTEAHTTHLTSIGGLKHETARIADALERIGERHARRMFYLALGGLVMLTTIIFLLIAAYTKTPLRIGSGDTTMEAGR